MVSINDSAAASLACSGTVTITITDVNDEVPTIRYINYYSSVDRKISSHLHWWFFGLLKMNIYHIFSSCPSSTLTMNEEVAAGTTLITLSASDGDNNETLTFSFAVDEPSFEINQCKNTIICEQWKMRQSKVHPSSKDKIAILYFSHDSKSPMTLVMVISCVCDFCARCILFVSSLCL